MNFKKLHVSGISTNVKYLSLLHELFKSKWIGAVISENIYYMQCTNRKDIIFFNLLKIKSIVAILSKLWKLGLKLELLRDWYCTYVWILQLFGGYCRANDWKVKKCFTSWRDDMRKTKNYFGWLFHLIMSTKTPLKFSSNSVGQLTEKPKTALRSWRDRITK